jgi:hypothetical protein
MGKCSNAFFSETTNMIKAKLYMNVHWMVLYNLKVFCSDMKLVSEEKTFKQFPHRPYVKTMSADGGHLGWRSGSLDIILKVDHLRTIHTMFALN